MSKIGNNGQILQFKVSKQLSRPAHQDEIIFKWCHHSYSGKNGTKCLKSEIMDGFCSLRYLSDCLDLPVKSTQRCT